MLKNLQQKLLGYTRISSERNVLFYITMFISVFSLIHFVYANMSVIMEFDKIVATFGMFIGVLIILLFDINRIMSLIFFVIILIAPRWVFPFIAETFPSPPMSIIMYAFSSVMFLVFEFLGFVLTADIYDSNAQVK